MFNLLPDWASGTGFVPPFKRLSLACMGTDSKEKKTGQILVGKWRFSRFPILFRSFQHSLLFNFEEWFFCAVAGCCFLFLPPLRFGNVVTARCLWAPVDERHGCFSGVILFCVFLEIDDIYRKPLPKDVFDGNSIQQQLFFPFEP